MVAEQVHYYSRGVTPTMDVTQNNWLLPLAGESWDVSPITEARIRLAIRFTETPAYDKSKGAIVNYFCEMQTACIREHMRLMGIKGVSGLRRDVIAKTIGWWMNRLDELTHRTKPVVKVPKSFHAQLLEVLDDYSWYTLSQIARRRMNLVGDYGSIHSTAATQVALIFMESRGTVVCTLHNGKTYWKKA